MSIIKVINSFKYAYQGIKKVFKEEQNFRIQSFCAVIVLISSIFIFNFSYIELALTFICISMVLSMEIINTVIENSWDHLEPNHHHVVKSVKDMMAGGVVITVSFSIFVWMSILIHKFF